MSLCSSVLYESLFLNFAKWKQNKKLKWSTHNYELEKHQNDLEEYKLWTCYTSNIHQQSNVWTKFDLTGMRICVLTFEKEAAVSVNGLLSIINKKYA